MEYGYATYVGQVLPDNRTAHGRGVCTWTDGERYEGEFRDGKQHDYGVDAFVDGDWYDGEWHDGEQHGRGVFRFADGRVFDGAWAGGFPLRGTAMEADGTRSLAVFDGRTFIWGDGWGKAARTAAGRPAEEWLGRDGGGGWRGTAVDAGGALFAGVQCASGGCTLRGRASMASPVTGGVWNNVVKSKQWFIPYNRQ